MLSDDCKLFHMMSKVFKLRYWVVNGAPEAHHVFRTRAGKTVGDLYNKHVIKPIWLKVLKSSFRVAEGEESSDFLSSNPLNELRNWRSRVWWA